MEESKEQQHLHRLLQFGIYLSVAFDILVFVYAAKILAHPWAEHYGLYRFFRGLSRMFIFYSPLYCKAFTFLMICLTSIGTLARKQKDLDPKNSIVYPLAGGFLVLGMALWCYGREGDEVLLLANWFELAYMGCSFFGCLLLHVAMDNISKIISSKLGKDKWNVEGESFMQATKPVLSSHAVNIPMLFYYKGKVRKGYIVLQNLYRGMILLGVPGSGKSFSVVMPVIRGMIANRACLVVYDIKFPDLGKIAYYHYLLAKQQGDYRDFRFHVINLNEPERSRRINPWKAIYLQTLADASETAEGLVEALKKGDKSGGSDQFFTQSAINFLAACVYFFSRHEDGRYSSLPHVLAFLNCSYEDIFSTLFSNKELGSLLSPFMTAFKARAFEQLEGQVGTLKIFISRLATKETFWVFSGDDFDLKINNPAAPGLLILANDPLTQSTNAACYSVILNRITKLINTKGNLPVGLILDEAASLMVNRLDLLLAQARSNRVATLLGFQSMQQIQQQYGKETAATITSIVGNVLSGSVQNKDTLDWLERIFGKVKQLSESLSIDRAKVSVSLSEKLEPLIPAGKIASLRAGEMVGLLAADAVEEYTGNFEPSAVHCRVNLDLDAIKKEEAAYRELPLFYDFKGKREEILLQNFNRITAEVQEVIKQFKPAARPVPVPPPMKGSMRPGL
ncbi:type IV secretory system conjugative DNA transfer family protein [Pedobacter sp. GR22-6]|uniref:type IV secretory system conjugative DNA transfer family protein n=1 Tax=Pedobacter sp. GR22-6 TaxID=3127957 RepID=UPI00307F9471